MVLVIGSNNCINCLTTKQTLELKGIDYEYKLLSDYTEEEQDKYREKAKEAKQMSLPILIKNDKIITLEEILNG